MTKEDVSIIRCHDYGAEAVYVAVKKAVDLIGGIKAFVRPGERLLLKPNILTAKPPEAAATTHPHVVEAAIRLVKEAGATPVVGDSPGLGSAVKCAEKSGILDVCRRQGVEFVDFKDVRLVDNPGGTFRRFEVAAEALLVDGIINLPKLKTHAQLYLTLGVKNMFGCVPGKRKPQWHLTAGVDSMYFANMLLDLYLFLKPRLTVMDGIVAMEGNGPGSGNPRQLGLVFAAANAVALDTAAVDVLGADAEKLPILKAARVRGIKGSRSEDVVTLGEKINDVRVRDFCFPPLVNIDFASGLPYFIGKRLRKALSSRPHIHDKNCTRCNICVEVCPPGIMQKRDRILIDYDQCIRCYCCQEVCPQGAITSRQGWLKRVIPGL